MAKEASIGHHAAQQGKATVQIPGRCSLPRNQTERKWTAKKYIVRAIRFPNRKRSGRSPDMAFTGIHCEAGIVPLFGHSDPTIRMRGWNGAEALAHTAEGGALTWENNALSATRPR